MDSRKVDELGQNLINFKPTSVPATERSHQHLMTLFSINSKHNALSLLRTEYFCWFLNGSFLQYKFVELVFSTYTEN